MQNAASAACSNERHGQGTGLRWVWMDWVSEGIEKQGLRTGKKGRRLERDGHRLAVKGLRPVRSGIGAGQQRGAVGVIEIRRLRR